MLFKKYKSPLKIAPRVSKKQMGILIVGSGPMAYKYADVVRQQPNLRLLAGYSQNKERASKWSGRFGVPCLRDFQSISEIPGINMAIIASAPYQHEKQLYEIIDRGIHVLCEKPLVTNLLGIDEVFNKAMSKSVQLGCTLQKRLNKTTYLAQEFLRDKSKGPVERVDVRLVYPRPRSYYDSPRKGQKALAGGGALITQGIHGLDLLVYLFGKATAIEGEIRNDFYRDIEVEDTAEINLEFSNNVKAHFYTSVGFSKAVEEYTLVCKKGIVKFNGQQWRRGWSRYKAAGLENVIAEFVDALLNKRELIVGGELVLETHRIINKIYHQ